MTVVAGSLTIAGLARRWRDPAAVIYPVHIKVVIVALYTTPQGLQRQTCQHDYMYCFYRDSNGGWSFAICNG